MKPLLIFYQELRSTSQLIEGRLMLIDSQTNKTQNIYVAASGSPGSQSTNDITARGRGPIPPMIDIDIPYYTVSTTPLYMPKVKGVEGNFYQISPYAVQIGNVSRGDFGVHFDKNVPGSAGCVVLRTALGWKAFEDDMKTFSDGDIRQVPLIVSYAR